MNKDQSLGELDRILLHISDEQVKILVSQHAQQYFNPDDKSSQTLKEYHSCFKCQKTPLDIQECIECREILCTPCQFELKKEENPKCPSCDEYLKVCKVSKKMLKKIEHMTETHLCEKKPEESNPDDPQSKETPTSTSQIEIQMKILELNDHIKKACPLSKVCKDCDETFKTIENFHFHLKIDCPHIEITCSECDQTFSRKFFKSTKHCCYYEKTQKKLATSIEKQSFFMQHFSPQMDLAALEKFQIPCPGDSECQKLLKSVDSSPGYTYCKSCSGCLYKGAGLKCEKEHYFCQDCGNKQFWNFD